MKRSHAITRQHFNIHPENYPATAVPTNIPDTDPKSPPIHPKPSFYTAYINEIPYAAD
ncbi:hypothetical protein DSO57_1012190 [Entomophthora muscae]|uniref:Uncharacterized protein n=1 Tax=Entomophthora muscae TaxID=34485 RepID=A0ACC2UFD1_9FUNG|nr:hypothetical protein DSO57_1012190 [Entomophthora muscae]